MKKVPGLPDRSVGTRLPLGGSTVACRRFVDAMATGTTAPSTTGGVDGIGCVRSLKWLVWNARGLAACR